MATRSAFNDDAYEMYRMDNVLDSVNLQVIGWNRATVADGQWLQDNAIGPLSARDVYLADQIDDVVGNVNNIKQILNDMGVGSGESGSNMIGYSVKPLNNSLENKSQWGEGTVSWSQKPLSIVPSGMGDPLVSPASLTYMTFGNDATKHDGITLQNGEIGGLLQANLVAGESYQLAFTREGLYYRRVNGTVGTTAVDAGDVSVVNDPGDFLALPFGAITQTQADGRYLQKTSTDYVKTTTYNTFTGKAITTDNITTTSHNSQNYVTAISGMRVLSPTEGLTEVNHDTTLTGKGTSTTALGVAYAPSASFADALSGADGTSSFSEITGAIFDKSVVTVSENAPWVSTMTVDSTAHDVFNPYEHTSDLFEVTGTDNKKLTLKYNNAVFSADSTHGLDFRVGADFTLPFGGPLSLAPISLTATHWQASHSKTIADWLLYIMNTLTVTEPT